MTPEDMKGELLKRGYVYEKDYDVFLHPKKLKGTHPKTYRIVADLLQEPQYHELILEWIDFEESFSGPLP